MSSSLVDPEIQAMLEFFETGVFSLERLPELRQPRALPPLDAELTDVSVEELSLPSVVEGDPDIRALLYRPVDLAAPAPALVEIHGGGYVIGYAEMNGENCRRYAQLLKGPVLSVDYRLAPETPYPGPLDDCYSALQWLYKNAGELQVDVSRIGIIGGSAGGGLAAGLALLARDRGEIPIAFQALVAPMIDDRTVTRWQQDPHPVAGQYVWTADKNRFGWTSYLGCEPGAETIPAYAAPARAGDLAGLPPAFLSTGALDMFAEENMEYARRLVRAGVPTEFHLYPGAVHGFTVMKGTRLAELHRRDVEAALKQALA